MFDIVLTNLINTKKKYINNLKSGSIISEIVPKTFSRNFPIPNEILLKIHQFVTNNPIYLKKMDLVINGIECIAYEGDSNDFFLSAKKYDTNYQPFYPTWMLSAYLLCLKASELGFKELIDIGSGDGRIPFCGALLGLRTIGIELDSNLTDLQKKIAKKTEIRFEIFNDDAARFDFTDLNLDKPIFLVSGLPEMGEMFLDNIIKITKENNRFDLFGIVLLASTLKRKFSSDTTHYGWGKIIDNNDLTIIEEIDLPTHWTNDNNTETKYLITKR